MVKLRLTRMGSINKPFYRVVAVDARARRDGRYIESIGYYDPKQDPPKVVIDEEKAIKWLKVGAQPTETVNSLLRKTGVLKVWHEIRFPKGGIPKPEKKVRLKKETVIEEIVEQPPEVVEEVVLISDEQLPEVVEEIIEVVEETAPEPAEEVVAVVEEQATEIIEEPASEPTEEAVEIVEEQTPEQVETPSEEAAKEQVAAIEEPAVEIEEEKTPEPVEESVEIVVEETPEVTETEPIEVAEEVITEEPINTEEENK
jgi:small subunit ribosomal protein S16